MQSMKTRISNILHIRISTSHINETWNSQYATLNGMGGFQGGAMTMGGIGNNSGIQFQQNIAMINSLKKSLNLAVQQNSKLKSRLKKIYLDADISDIPEVSDKF